MHMPDENHLTLRIHPDPERIDLGAIKTDLEFFMKRVAKQPTRRNLFDMTICGSFWTAGIVLLGEWLLLHW
jgi:hypothetical protein